MSISPPPGSSVGGTSDVPGLDAALAAKQPLDSDLTAIAALSTTSYGRSLLALADAAAARSTIGLPLHNYSATTDPGVGDDSGDGYGVGSEWINTTGDSAWKCVDASVGAAVWVPFESAGGGPLLYVDSLALHADGDEFADPTLAAFSLAGGLGTGNVTAVTTEPYDATCLDIVFPSMGARALRALPGSWTYLYLTIHGLTAADSAGMIGLSLVDASGNGLGLSTYNDGATYLWAVTAYNYSGSGPSAGAWTTVNGGPAASNRPMVLRIRKSGTSYYGGLSFNGGLSFQESIASVTAATFNRFGVARHYSGGGSTPKLRVGRLNAA